MNRRGLYMCRYRCIHPCNPFGLTLFGTFWRDYGTMLPQSASGACFRQAPGGRREWPVPLMSNSDGSQNGLRYRCGLCSARANRACRTPGFSGCGYAAVGSEPGTDAACTYRTPHDRMCLWVFSQTMLTLYSTSMRKANANPCAAACHGVWGAAPASNSNPSPRQRPSLVG